MLNRTSTSYSIICLRWWNNCNCSIIEKSNLYYIRWRSNCGNLTLYLPPCLHLNVNGPVVLAQLKLCSSINKTTPHCFDHQHLFQISFIIISEIVTSDMWLTQKIKHSLKQYWYSSNTGIFFYFSEFYSFTYNFCQLYLDLHDKNIRRKQWPKVFKGRNRHCDGSSGDNTMALRNQIVFLPEPVL